MESEHPNPGGMEQTSRNAARQAESVFNGLKQVTSDTLHTAARTLRENADRAAESFQPAAEYGRRASEWLDRSASYVQELELQRMRSGAEEAIRRNPGRSLLLAAVAGLVVGAVIRRR